MHFPYFLHIYDQFINKNYTEKQYNADKYISAYFAVEPYINYREEVYGNEYDCQGRLGYIP